jgi:hypothetical protein
MNKFFKISVIAVLLLAIVITVFAFSGTSTQLALGNICPNVGWNTRAATSTFASQNVQELALCGPGVIPNVGWNT